MRLTVDVDGPPLPFAFPDYMDQTVCRNAYLALNAGRNRGRTNLPAKEFRSSYQDLNNAVKNWVGPPVPPEVNAMLDWVEQHKAW